MPRHETKICNLVPEFDVQTLMLKNFQISYSRLFLVCLKFHPLNHCFVHFLSLVFGLSIFHILGHMKSGPGKGNSNSLETNSLGNYVSAIVLL